MLKWLVTLLIVLVIVAVATPWLGIRRVPGDFRIPLRGRVYYVPLGSTLLLCALMWLVGKIL